MAVGCKAAEDGVLRIVHDNFRTFLAVVLFELGKGLNDGNDLQTPRPRRTKHHLCRLYLGQRAELIAEEYTAVLELAAVFIGNGECLTVELLDNQ